MPKYQIQTPKGAFEVDSPHDLSDQEVYDLVGHATGQAPYTPPLSPEQQQANVAKGQRDVFQQQSGTDQLLSGVGRGLMDMYSGVEQLGLQAGSHLVDPMRGAGNPGGTLQPGAPAQIVDPQAVHDFNANQDAERQVYDTMAQGSGLATAGRIVGQAAPTFAIPMGNLARGAGLWQTVAQGAAAGAAGAGMQYTPEDESRLGNMAKGAAAGAVTAGVLKGAGAVVGKTVNAIRGKLSPEAAALEETARKAGIRTTYGDVSGNPVAQRAETLLENVPVVGTSKFRAAQSKEVTQAIGSLSDNLEEVMKATPYKGLEGAEKAAASGDKAAQKLLDEVKEAGNDWTRVIQTSGSLKGFRAKQVAGRLYDKVDELAGTANVPAQKTKAALQSAIQDLQSSKIPDDGQIKLFQGILSRLEEKPTLEQSQAIAAEQATRASQAAQAADRAASSAEMRAGVYGVAGKDAAGAAQAAQGNADQLSQSKFFSWPEKAVQDARTAAEKARAAALEANTRGAVSAVSRQAADRAEAAAQGAERKYAVADAAALIKRTGDPEQAARLLIEKHGLADKDLRSALSTAIDRSGKPIPGADNSFGNLRMLRSDLGDKLRDLAPKDAKAARLLGSVKGALDEDLQSYATTGDAQLARAWRRADGFYRDQYVPMKAREFTKAFSSDEPDRIFGEMIKSGRGDRAQKFYDALDDKGRAAVRFGMVRQALEKSLSEKTAQQSPARFAGLLERIKDATGVFFKGQDKWELDGFTKLMRHVERAGQYAENPPTGNRLVQLLLGAGSLASPHTAAQVGGGAAVLRSLFTTTAGKRFLLASADLTPGSKAMASLVAQLEEHLPAIAGMLPQARSAIGSVSVPKMPIPAFASASDTNRTENR
jgi:hypothetical protein